MAQHVIAHSRECLNGKCPTFIRDTEAGGVWVRGFASPSATKKGDPELDTFIPDGEWEFLLSQLPR